MGGFVVWWKTVLVLVPGVNGIEVEINEIEKGVDMISARLHGLPERFVVSLVTVECTTTQSSLLERAGDAVARVIVINPRDLDQRPNFSAVRSVFSSRVLL